jgi:protein-glutamine gamma-glutamyltransferase
VGGFLHANFSYSSYLTKEHAATSNETALARFLLKERTGHCEYFATAATLLLRKAAVPTRYAVGYAVHEGREKKWTVRERDGHAWTLVYHSGRWHDFDTTPASWTAMERGESSWLQPLKDLASNLWFQFSKWRWSNTEWRKYLIWIPIPLVTIALATFFLKKQWRHIRRPEQERRRDWPGKDSELYAVEQALASRGLNRGTGESWSAWLARIEQYQRNAEELRPLILLHSKYRFDPQGLNGEERAELRANAKAFLQHIKRSRVERR